MWQKEAKWLGDVIYGLDATHVFPMLDIGSSTEKYRKETQPWIDRYVFAPGRDKGLKVVHCDIVEGSGIDICGDLSDQSFAKELRKMGFKSILCANLLEHVTNREHICSVLESIVKPGGIILVTVPYRCTYHLDPIDSGYRPIPQDLSKLFPRSVLVRSEILDCGRVLRLLWPGIRRLFVKDICKSVSWSMLRRCHRVLWFRGWHPLSKFKTTCVVLQKKLAGAAQQGDCEKGT